MQEIKNTFYIAFYLSESRVFEESHYELPRLLGVSPDVEELMEQCATQDKWLNGEQLSRKLLTPATWRRVRVNTWHAESGGVNYSIYKVLLGYHVTTRAIEVLRNLLQNKYIFATWDHAGDQWKLVENKGQMSTSYVGVTLGDAIDDYYENRNDSGSNKTHKTLQEGFELADGNDPIRWVGFAYTDPKHEARYNVVSVANNRNETMFHVEREDSRYSTVERKVNEIFLFNRYAEQTRKMLGSD